MAARVTDEEVLAILPEETAVSYENIQPFIDSANVFVTDLLEGKLAESVLAEIEKWIAAHMASVVNDRAIKEAGAGGAYVKYAGIWGEELSATQFGQMALMLDTTNTLRNLKQGKMKAWTYAVPGR